MNEKIRALALKSQLVCVNDLNGELVSSFQEDVDVSEELEDFAELIVRECAEVVSNQYSEDWGKLSNKMILEHFGVEE